jgi:hypothetical protein
MYVKGQKPTKTTMAAILHFGLVLVDKTSGSRRLLTNMAKNLMFCESFICLYEFPQCGINKGNIFYFLFCGSM